MAPQHEPRWGPPPLRALGRCRSCRGGGPGSHALPLRGPQCATHATHACSLPQPACTLAHVLTCSDTCHMLADACPRLHTCHAHTPSCTLTRPSACFHSLLVCFHIHAHTFTLLPAYLHTPACTLTHTYMLTHLDTPSCTLTHHHTLSCMLTHACPQKAPWGTWLMLWTPTEDP